jgi:hypothetical protein
MCLQARQDSHCRRWCGNLTLLRMCSVYACATYYIAVPVCLHSWLTCAHIHHRSAQCHFAALGAVRFTLGDASLESIRVHKASEVINHRLLAQQRTSASCTTEVGFTVRTKDGKSFCLSVRRYVTAAGRSQYFTRKNEQAPAADVWLSSTMQSASLVRQE